MKQVRNHQITSSWVIINKETDEVLFETYNKDIIAKLNTEKYIAVPIGSYLGTLTNNRK